MAASIPARTLIARVCATKMGPLQRLVGSLDVHGKGTLHPLHDVDPVVLWDKAKIKGVGLPGFGMHPHYGVIACTYVVDGAIKDSDNLGASHDGLTEAGSIYCASSGRGICHEEATAVEDNEIYQVVVRIPLGKLGLPPSITKAEKSQLPTLYGGAVTVVVGKLDGTASPTPEA
jgi:redox-sensitive bicupin YhaK (pirin superfamily)